ncbi:MAG: hypothetical protein J6I62_08225 [Selenomonadaceae bacterium]|nr:hypothetical protein [Selenomonadaceae bacterium]
MAANEEKDEEKKELVYYSDGEFRFYKLTTNGEFTDYVTSFNWSGSIDAAARSVNFTIAYTTPKKDADFKNMQIDLGERILMIFVPRNTAKVIMLFNGVVFLKNRSSDGYSMDFTAFDDMVYLAKSEVQMKFSNMPAKDIITQTCNSLNVKVGNIHEDFNIKCDFIADKMTATEVINKCIKACEAQYGWRYKAVILPSEGKEKGGKWLLNVVRADGNDVVANFKISDETNLLSAQHGSSIEDMVNQVAIVNDNGDVTGYIKLPEEIKKYGLIQKVYKYNQKEVTENAAKLLLKKVKEHSSLSALGNIECVSGFVIDVEEEQIKGQFMIIADRHSVQNGQYRMELTLDYIVKPDDRTGAVSEGNVNPMPTKNNGAKKKAGRGIKAVKPGLSEGINAFKGQSYTPDPKNGCVWAATGISSYYSPWAAEQFNNGVVYVPTLIQNARAAGMYHRYGECTLEPGDIIVYGDSHVVVSTGGYGYAGNSSSKKKVVVGSDFTNMSGKYATGVIKTSRG